MSSRENILARIKANQPPSIAKASSDVHHEASEASVGKFINILKSIGGEAREINHLREIKNYVTSVFPDAKEIVSEIMQGYFESQSKQRGSTPQELKNIDLAILEGEFGVAENGAVWVTEKNLIDRALPFICANLILVIRKENIVATLHEAYEIISDAKYEFGAFIAGPSKTADIEQSLVLGAHGAKTMAVFIIQ
jgi:L-lactate dehydrogenase complex protein LldG